MSIDLEADSNGKFVMFRLRNMSASRALSLIYFRPTIFFFRPVSWERHYARHNLFLDGFGRDKPPDILVNDLLEWDSLLKLSRLQRAKVHG